MYQDLSAEDFRNIFHLLGSCEDRWLHPEQWQRHFLEGLSQLIHLPVGLIARVEDFATGAPPRVLHALEHGWPDVGFQGLFQVAMRRSDPFRSPLDLRFRKIVARRGNIAATRPDLLPDSQWRGTPLFEECFRPARMHEMLYSSVQLGPASAVSHLLGFGGEGHRPTERDRQLVEFAHHELVRLIGTRLADPIHVSTHGLSPRRRQVLDHLIAGLPEKIVADQLGLRPSTVNELVQAIYAHFAVHSRAELMAYIARRIPVLRLTGPPK